MTDDQDRPVQWPDSSAPRIKPGGRKELGILNWAISRVAARSIRVPQMHLLTALGQQKLLFLSWLPYSLVLLYRGRLPRRDAELVILRVGHLRDCEYELQQHRRLARSRGVDAQTQGRIFAGPEADGLTARQRALLKATDEFVLDRAVSAPTWAQLASHLDSPSLIEFCALAGQYDTLAATITTLKLPLDFPD